MIHTLNTRTDSRRRRDDNIKFPAHVFNAEQKTCHVVFFPERTHLDCVCVYLLCSTLVSHTQNSRSLVHGIGIFACVVTVYHIQMCTSHVLQPRRPR